MLVLCKWYCCCCCCFVVRFLENGRKERYAKRSGVAIPKPRLEPRGPERMLPGPKDTLVDDVLRETWEGISRDTKLFDFLGSDGQFGLSLTEEETRISDNN